MKKILFLLLSTVAMYGQVPADATPLENIQITNNKNSTTATKVNVQEANGAVNTQTINTGFNKNIGLGGSDVVGANTLLNQYSTTPVDWTATAFNSGQVVFYGGKQWIAKMATVDGDVPAVSSKWEEITFEALANKTVIVDATPTDGSNNAVSSNGVFDDLALKANLESPTFIGFVSVPDAAAGSISNQAANVRFVQNGYFRDYKNIDSNPDTFDESFHSRIGAISENPFGTSIGASGFSSMGTANYGWQLFGAGTGELSLKARVNDGGVFTDWYDILTSSPIKYIDVSVPNTANFAIRTLVESITDASYNKRYVVHVPNGTYFELDIRTKEYIDIVGQSKEGVIINLDGNSTVVAPSYLSIGTGGVPINTIDDSYKHIFWAVKTSKVSNMTLNCTNAKYAIHQDGLGDYESVFENIIINQGSIIRPVGIGSRYGQKQIYRNCFFNNISNNWAVGWHNWESQTGGSSLLLDNCISEYGMLIAEELGSGQDDYLTLTNCRSVQMNEFQIVSAVSVGYDTGTTPYNINIVLDNTYMTVFQTTRPNYKIFNKDIEINNLFKAYRHQGISVSYDTGNYNSYPSAFQTKPSSLTKDNSKIYPLLSGESTDGGFTNTVSFGYTRPTTTVDGTPNGEAYIGLVGNGMLGKFWKFRADGSIFSPGQITAPSYTGSATLTGTPTAPTAATGTNTTQIATTAFVQQNARPYKVYTALLSQSNTDAPVAIVLENTIGNIVWTRLNTGQYLGTLTGAFTLDKTICFTGGNTNNANIHHTTQRNNDSSVVVETYNSGAKADYLLAKTSIEIRVYL